MLEFPVPLERELRGEPPRCLNCAYLLVSLEIARCPECGRAFNPADPRSFTRRPGFVLWRYWLPGLLLAVGGGSAIGLLFLLSNNIGWGLSLALPFSVGALLGYGVRLRTRLLTLLALGVIVCIIMILRMQGAVGLLCGLILCALFLAPVAVGLAAGVTLRLKLKDKRPRTWDQAWYLPVILLLLLPGAVHIAERLCRFAQPPEEYSTTMVMPVSVHRAWKSHMLESRDHEPATMMKAGLPRPLALDGNSYQVGDTRICKLSKGQLTVRITEREEDRVLAFRFIGQKSVEDRAVRLLDARLTFEPAGAGQTRVTLTTRYQPLMTPRWYWRIAERQAGASMHEYLLEEMSRDAQLQRNGSVAIGSVRTP